MAALSYSVLACFGMVDFLLVRISAVKGLASASTLVSPASNEANHYRDIVSSMQEKSYGRVYYPRVGF